MTNTGKFASDEQIQTLKDRLKAPVMYLSGGQEMAGKSAQEMCHQFALDAGLPEINGFYGVRLDTKEFVKS